MTTAGLMSYNAALISAATGGAAAPAAGKLFTYVLLMMLYCFDMNAQVTLSPVIGVIFLPTHDSESSHSRPVLFSQLLLSPAFYLGQAVRRRPSKCTRR